MPYEVVLLRVDFFKSWTNIAAVATETKKGGFKTFLDSFHQTS
jgi:hypothetical protein